MAKSSKRARAAKRRSLIGELMSGVQAMRDHREGRLIGAHRLFCGMFIPSEVTEGEFHEFEFEFFTGVVTYLRKLLEDALRATLHEIREGLDLAFDE